MVIKSGGQGYARLRRELDAVQGLLEARAGAQVVSEDEAQGPPAS
jgi:hypothetical protein